MRGLSASATEIPPHLSIREPWLPHAATLVPVGQPANGFKVLRSERCLKSSFLFGLETVGIWLSQKPLYLCTYVPPIHPGKSMVPTWLRTNLPNVLPCSKNHARPERMTLSHHVDSAKGGNCNMSTCQHVAVYLGSNRPFNQFSQHLMGDSGTSSFTGFLGLESTN